VNFLMVEIHIPKPYIFMIRVARQIKCLIAQAPGFIPHPLPEVNFLMVEIPTFKPYIYSLFSYLFIKQDQMIMTCNSAVASLMLSRFFICISTLKKEKYPSHNTVSYLFICISMLKKETLPIPQYSKLFIYLFVSPIWRSKNTHPTTQ
jgi:hypothetical protein